MNELESSRHDHCHCAVGMGIRIKGYKYKTIGLCVDEWHDFHTTLPSTGRSCNCKTPGDTYHLIAHEYCK
jgi:hypothetical protein